MDQDQLSPVACTLDAADAKQQLTDWGALGSSLQSSKVLDTGAVLWFDSGVESDLRAVAAREATCCGFLSLDVTPEPGTVRLDITTNNPDGVPVIQLLVAQVVGDAS